MRHQVFLDESGRTAAASPTMVCLTDLLFFSVRFPYQSGSDSESDSTEAEGDDRNASSQSELEVTKVC